jgi:hypothetical protein
VSPDRDGRHADTTQNVIRCAIASIAAQSGHTARILVMPSTLLAQLYPEHLTTLKARADAALARAGYDHLVVPAGTAHTQFLDDVHYPYAVNPQFKAWLPVTKAPGSWLVYTPG